MSSLRSKVQRTLQVRCTLLPGAYLALEINESIVSIRILFLPSPRTSVNDPESVRAWPALQAVYEVERRWFGKEMR